MSSVAKQATLEKVIEIANRVGASESIEIVDVELLGGGNNRVLRIFIDKPGGVTHADCETISEKVGAVLDVEDVMTGGAYTLEVSSPGVERKLKTLKDFERFLGKRVRVLLREPVDNRRQWEGAIAAVRQDVIQLDTSPGKTVEFPHRQVERANLKFEW